jgi:hypothetical protein
MAVGIGLTLKGVIAITSSLAKFFTVSTAIVWVVGLVSTLLGCFSFSAHNLLMNAHPGDESDLLKFSDTPEYILSELKQSWANMREAKKLSETPCEWDLSLQGSITDKLNTIFNLGLKSNTNKIKENINTAIDHAKSSVLGFLNLLQSDYSKLDKIGVDNENYSGSAQPYFNNATKILSELNVLESFFIKDQIPNGNFSSNLALNFIEIFENKPPTSPQFDPAPFLNYSAGFVMHKEDSIYEDSRKYLISTYNKLVGRPSALIDELYLFHVELDTASKMMENERSTVLAYYEENKKTAEEKVEELDNNEIWKIDATLISDILSKIGRSEEETFYLNAQEGSASPSKDLRKITKQIKDSEAIFNSAKIIFNNKAEDYLYYSIEELKKANALAQTAKLNAENLFLRLWDFKDFVKKNFEKLASENFLSYTSEPCKEAKIQKELAENEKSIGQALIKYNKALSLLQSCAAVSQKESLDYKSFDFKNKLEYIEKIINQLKGKVDVSFEELKYNSLKNNNDYKYALEMQRDIDSIIESLKIKAEPLLRKITNLQETVQDYLSAAYELKAETGFEFDSLTQMQNDFDFSLNLEPIINAGTLYDKYLNIIEKLGQQVELASSKFIEKQAKLTLVFDEIPKCNEQSNATLIIRIKNPLSIELAKEEVGIHIKPVFSNELFIKVKNLGPGEEFYFEQNISALAGICKVEKTSIYTTNNYADWFVTLDVVSFTEKIFVDVDGNYILLSGDKEVGQGKNIA